MLLPEASLVALVRSMHQGKTLGDLTKLARYRRKRPKAAPAPEPQTTTDNDNNNLSTALSASSGPLV
jgi:hypothetical protein